MLYTKFTYINSIVLWPSSSVPVLAEQAYLVACNLDHCLRYNLSHTAISTKSNLLPSLNCRWQPGLPHSSVLEPFHRYRVDWLLRADFAKVMLHCGNLFL